MNSRPYSRFEKCRNYENQKVGNKSGEKTMRRAEQTEQNKIGEES